MRQERVKIGILGGTFNPVHCGHLIVAEAVREQYSLDKVLFIPSGLPPHKPNQEIAAGEDRYRMVSLAIDPNPNFEALRIEIDRQGYTYTIDTLKTLRTIYNEDTLLYFITGADVIPELTTWRSFGEVFGLCEFIGVLRPGHGEEPFRTEIDVLKQRYDAVIHTAEAPLIEISSTDIRSRVASGRSIKYLVPDAVEDYIRKNGLYLK